VQSARVGPCLCRKVRLACDDSRQAHDEALADAWDLIGDQHKTATALSADGD
jgi:hypothetical protein